MPRWTVLGTSVGLPVLALAALCLAVYAILLAAGSALTFRGDDWGFLEARGGLGGPIDLPERRLRVELPAASTACTAAG